MTARGNGRDFPNYPTHEQDFCRNQALLKAAHDAGWTSCTRDTELQSRETYSPSHTRFAHTPGYATLTINIVVTEEPCKIKNIVAYL